MGKVCVGLLDDKEKIGWKMGSEEYFSFQSEAKGNCVWERQERFLAIKVWGIGCGWRKNIEKH